MVESCQEVKALSFNYVGPESKHYVVCTTNGFRLFQTSNCNLLVQCDSIPGGLKLCAPYRQTNLFFVVATGVNPDMSSNKLGIWDQEQQKLVAEIEFLEPIIDLCAMGRWVAVAHKDQVTVFDFESGNGFEQERIVVPTKIDRRHQLAMQVCEEEGARIAVPSVQKIGYASIVFVPNTGIASTLTLDVTGDQAEIQMMEFTQDMIFLAVASSDGRYIRVIDMELKELKVEFCRGKSVTVVNSLNFIKKDPNANAYYLAVCSDTTTCHIFEVSEGENKNSKSMFSSFGAVMPKYYSSQFAALKFNLTNVANEPSNKKCALMMTGGSQGQEQPRLKLFIVHDLHEPRYVEADMKADKMEQSASIQIMSRTKN